MSIATYANLALFTNANSTINNFFTTWYFALEFAAQQASQSISEIIKTIDPLKKTNVLNDVLTVLSIGLAFIAMPELEGVEAATKAIGSLVVTAIAQAPAIGKTLWPIGTVDSELYQIGELQNLLANIDSQLLDVLQRGLIAVESNITQFLAFANTGNFSGPDPPSLYNDTVGLDIAFKTYLVSTALAQTGWKAIAVIGFEKADPHEIQVNSSAPLPGWIYDCSDCSKWHNLKCPAYDSNGQCGYWWYSSVNEGRLHTQRRLRDQSLLHDVDNFRQQLDNGLTPARQCGFLRSEFGVGY